MMRPDPAEVVWQVRLDADAKVRAKPLPSPPRPLGPTPEQMRWNARVEARKARKARRSLGGES